MSDHEPGLWMKTQSIGWGARGFWVLVAVMLAMCAGAVAGALVLA